MDPKLPDRETIQNLADAGCDDEMVRCYCELECRAGKRPPIRREQIRLLGKHRKALLGELHSCQEKIDCLDYLLYKLKDEQSEEAEKKDE